MKLPLWFWISSSLVTLIYLLFSVLFTMETFSSAEFLIKSFGQKNADIIAERTWWAKTGYALSVYFGLFGSIMLFFRTPHLHWIALISLSGMIIQQSFWWTHPLTVESLKESSFIWAVIIPLISFLLVGLSFYWKKVS